MKVKVTTEEIFNEISRYLEVFDNSLDLSSKIFTLNEYWCGRCNDTSNLLFFLKQSLEHSHLIILRSILDTTKHNSNYSIEKLINNLHAEGILKEHSVYITQLDKLREKHSKVLDFIDETIAHNGFNKHKIELPYQKELDELVKDLKNIYFDLYNIHFNENPNLKLNEKHFKTLKRWVGYESLKNEF